MTNPFANRSPSLAGPALDMMPVVPDDGADLSQGAVALYVETGGDLAFVSAAGQARQVKVSDNMILPCGVLRVMASGTTASGIHAFTIG